MPAMVLGLHTCHLKSNRVVLEITISRMRHKGPEGYTGARPFLRTVGASACLAQSNLASLVLPAELGASGLQAQHTYGGLGHSPQLPPHALPAHLETTGS